MLLSSCVRRMSDSIDKRFCFDVTAEGRPGLVYTLQALSEADRKGWLDAMDGREPTYEQQTTLRSEERPLDDVGFSFVQRCIQVLESRGLEEQGLYRVTGVASKVSKLLSLGLDRRKGLPSNLEDPCEWESKTITSALKNYLRTLPEPIMTHRFHNGFIAAAKQENRADRVNDVHTLVHRLPKPNFDMLEIVIRHLRNVVSKADKNLMSVSNVAVCFGPTLLRPEEETVAAIMDLKFYNVVVEILIDNYEAIFNTQPPEGRLNGTRLRTPPVGAAAAASLEPRVAAVRPVSAIAHNTVQVKSYYDGPLAASRKGQPPSLQLHQHTNRAYSPPALARYSPHHHQIMQQFGGSAHALSHHGVSSNPSDSLLNSTSSSESVSSVSSRDLVPPSGMPPPGVAPTGPPPPRRGVSHVYYATGYRPQHSHNLRVRTLYACLGESEGELSFEPNQIITNVKSSAEPGWLEGTLNGRTGLVPENYVEALP